VCLKDTFAFNFGRLRHKGDTRGDYPSLGLTQ
jgi:hypothetical protein